jgi:hypothetical protein
VYLFLKKILKISLEFSRICDCLVFNVRCCFLKTAFIFYQTSSCLSRSFLFFFVVVFRDNFYILAHLPFPVNNFFLVFSSSATQSGILTGFFSFYAFLSCDSFVRISNLWINVKHFLYFFFTFLIMLRLCSYCER